MLWITALLQSTTVTSDLFSLLATPFPMLKLVFCTFSYMGCCLVALYLGKSSLGTFSSWCLILGHLFLFLICAEHFPAWQKLCSPLLHPWCLCFPQIQRKTLKQSSEAAWICFFSPREKMQREERRNNSRRDSTSSAQIASPGFLCWACVLPDGLSTHCTYFCFKAEREQGRCNWLFIIQREIARWSMLS